MSENSKLKVYSEPRFRETPTLLVAWSTDAARLGAKTAGYLRKKLGATKFAEIEPTDFFPLNGVSIEDDVAQFPESAFYYSQEHSLVILESDLPRSGWHSFLDLVLDVAEQRCHAREFYTIGAMISFGAHTAPRELLAVANSPEMRAALENYDLSRQMEYETPPGQRPTLSSYLLWMARKRNMMGASLWTPVPFYLVTNEDPLACRKVLSFIDKRLSLGIDFADLDGEVSAQREKLAKLRAASPEIDSSINKLESSLGLTQEQNERLAKEVEEFLRKSDQV